MSKHNTWIGRKDRALGVRDRQRRIWDDSINLYNCEYFEKLYGGIDPERVDVHFANWYVSNLVPLVYFRDPYNFVKAKNSRWQAFSETMEEVLNYEWGELGLKQQFKKVILSAFLTPPGWLRLGYTAKFAQDIGKIEEEREKSLIKDIKAALIGSVRKDKAPSEQGILDMNIKEDSIFASWIPSWNMLLTPGYHDIAKMPWLIEIEDMSMVDFKANPVFKNKTDAKAMRSVSDKASGGSVSKPSYSKDIEGEDEEQIIRLYHAWDRREMKRLTYSENAIHFEGDWPYDMEGFAHKPLIFEETLPQEDKSNPYPVNALKPIFPQIMEQSNARTMMVKHRKRANALILVQKGIYNEGEINQLEENGSVQIVEVPSIQSVQGMTIPSLPPDVYNIDKIIQQDLQMATSMGQLMFQAQPGQRTATQAQLAQTGLQLKSSARVDCIEDFTRVVARSLAQLIWQFYPREKVAEIIGKPVTSEMWPDLPDDPKERKRVIQAELSFRIDPGSTAPPKDETVDRKQFIDAMSVAATIAPERLKKDEAIKQLFKRFKYIKDLDKIVVSGDEEEMQAAQRENELMAAGAPQVVSPNENHMIHIQVHSQAQGNELVDMHIMEHGKYLGGVEGKGAPQEGKRPPAQSSNPQIMRQGATNQGDLYQSSQNLGIGTGSEVM